MPEAPETPILPPAIQCAPQCALDCQRGACFCDPGLGFPWLEDGCRLFDRLVQCKFLSICNIRGNAFNRMSAYAGASVQPSRGRLQSGRRQRPGVARRGVTPATGPPWLPFHSCCCACCKPSNGMRPMPCHCTALARVLDGHMPKLPPVVFGVSATSTLVTCGPPHMHLRLPGQMQHWPHARYHSIRSASR